MREATDQNRANLAAVAGERQSEAERIERALATPGERILEGFRPGAEARWTRGIGIISCILRNVR
jgi:hypothetical protein